jgi:hypothetical protein
MLPCLILAGTYLGGIWPGISHHVDSNFVALLSVACLVLWHTRPRNSLLIAAGLLAGVTTCIYQPKGVFLFCALLAWLWLQRRRTSAPLSVLALPAGGYFAIVGIVLAYFWSRGALGSLVYANFVFSRQNYGAVNAVAYAFGIFKFYWTPWAMAFGEAKWLLGIAAILITPFSLSPLSLCSCCSLAFDASGSLLRLRLRSIGFVDGQYGCRKFIAETSSILYSDRRC